MIVSDWIWIGDLDKIGEMQYWILTYVLVAKALEFFETLCRFIFGRRTWSFENLVKDHTREGQTYHR